MADPNASPAAPSQSTLPDATANNTTNATQSTQSASQMQSQDPPADSSEDATMQEESQPAQSSIQPASQQQLSDNADLDASIAPELEAPLPPPSSADMMQLDGSADVAPATQNGPSNADLDPAVLTEPRIPQKKDASLREFLSKMDDYAPLIPDAVTDYYLTLAGLPPPPDTDRKLARLLALATQKFIADVAADAYQYSRIRSTNTTSNNPLTGLGGAAGFGMGGVSAAQGGEGGEGAGAAGGGGKGKKDAGKNAPLGGPRAGYGGGGAGAGQGRTVLTMEDLGMAVGECGVNVKRGEFYR